jgi:hypothetical protein
MMGEDIRFASEMEPSRGFAFLGKAAIYSAGTTFMGFFIRENRYLTRGSRLMIHERSARSRSMAHSRRVLQMSRRPSTRSSARLRSRTRAFGTWSMARTSHWRRSSVARPRTGMSRRKKR